MKKTIRILLSTGILVLAGCSGVKVDTTAQASPSEIASGKQYVLRVQTGDPLMNQLLYEFSFHEISRFLNLSEKQDASDGTIDVLFTTVGQNKTVGSGVGVASGSATASGWYTGGTATALGVGSSFYSSETKTKQLSTMIVSIKSNSGQRLWWADLDLKGKGSVKTPSESARYLASRLAIVMKDAKFKPIQKNS